MPTPEQIYEVKTKAAKLVKSEFGGDFGKAFAFYDKNDDGKINNKELLEFLTDAGIGGGWGLGWLRQQWATGIMTEADKDADELISLAEFNALLGLTDDKL